MRGCTNPLPLCGAEGEDPGGGYGPPKGAGSNPETGPAKISMGKNPFYHNLGIMQTRVPGHVDTGQWMTFSTGPAPPVSHIERRSDEGSDPE